MPIPAHCRSNGTGWKAGTRSPRRERQTRCMSPAAVPGFRIGRTSTMAILACRARCDTRGGLNLVLHRGAPSQVGLDQEPRAAAEAHAIDLQVLHDALDVVARLRKRNAFDPVDRIDLGIARIAVLLDPFTHATATGIVAGEGHDVRAAI